MAEMTGENMIIFKTPTDEWGEFSNQYPAPYTYMGIRFETVEQFLYYMKAIFGRSKATADKVLASGGDSAALSKISKKQRLMEGNSWEAVRPQIMRVGMRQKFLQNPELRKKLLSTGFRLLVEMPKEGLLERLIPGSEDWIRDPGKWKGRNQAGKALMQARADLRCADRLVGPDDVYVFPKEPFILQTPIGQMNLQELSALPGARASVRAYAETAQQYQEFLLTDADDYINRNRYSLITTERAIASNKADIENALNHARAIEAEKVNGVSIAPTPQTETTGAAEAPGIPEEASAAAAETGAGAELTFGAAPEAVKAPEAPEALQEVPADTAEEKLPDDIPEEGFYELLYDLDEMMKLGII